MTLESVGPDRLGAVYEALAQWRMFARTAHVAAQAQQRTLSLDLLHTARHLAAGIDALTRLEQQHRHHATVLHNLHGSAVHTAERLEHRAGSVRRLVEAAGRVADDPARSTAQRSQAATIRERAHTQIEALDQAARLASRALAETARLIDRHARVDGELAELRREFTDLRADAERGLAAMTSAGRMLGEVAETYEGAQLSANDLRRGLVGAGDDARLVEPGVDLTPADLTLPDLTLKASA